MLAGWEEEEEPAKRWAAWQEENMFPEDLGDSEGTTGFGHVEVISKLTRTVVNE